MRMVGSSGLKPSARLGNFSRGAMPRAKSYIEPKPPQLAASSFLVLSPTLTHQQNRVGRARIRSPRIKLDTLRLKRIDAWQATAESARVQIFAFMRECRHKALSDLSHSRNRQWHSG